MLKSMKLWELGFFSEFSGCIGTGRKFEFLIIRDANQGACESDAFADSEMIR